MLHGFFNCILFPNESTFYLIFVSQTSWAKMVKFSVQVQVRSIIDADIGQFYNIQRGGPPKKKNYRHGLLDFSVKTLLFLALIRKRTLEIWIPTLTYQSHAACLIKANEIKAEITIWLRRSKSRKRKTQQRSFTEN